MPTCRFHPQLVAWDSHKESFVQSLKELLLMDKNPAPLRMPKMLVLSQYQKVFGHPKWCRICLNQPYDPQNIVFCVLLLSLGNC